MPTAAPIAIHSTSWKNPKTITRTNPTATPTNMSVVIRSVRPSPLVT
nr:hypothetical protein N8D75_15635 [Curtobacterium flaccumfaciens]